MVNVELTFEQLGPYLKVMVLKLRVCHLHAIISNPTTNKRTTAVDILIRKLLVLV